MARGNHAPARKHRAIAIVAIVAGVLVLAAGGAAYSAYRYEQARADRILPGVTIAGVDVGGMTKAEAVVAVRDAAAIALQQQIRLRAGGRSWQVTLEELGQRSNAVGAVNRALGAERVDGHVLPLLAPVQRRPGAAGGRALASPATAASTPCSAASPATWP